PPDRRGPAQRVPADGPAWRGADGQLRARLSQRAGGARPVRRGQRAGPFRPWLLHRPRVVQGGGDPRGHQFQVRPRPDGRRGVRGDRHPGRAPGRFRTGRDAGRGKLMEFGFDERTEELRAVLLEFMDAHVYPAEAVFSEQLAALENRWAWSTVPVLAELRALARSRGLWHFFLPGEHGGGLTTLQYAPLAEILERSHLGPVAMNCSAPDTSNMEVLA